ncbi:hypothetical protein CC80DRAFT_593699 [Byssothecium circinans]|uniref:Methyltransferase domain-containing protein n=1 Tax=Byssothecium circinans TaxID=147558 RepID=A0A6A5TUW8_9PLEO|nr:hypothetical protein CC80DRAFT_593699 [Byssothecium circinans]
MPLNPPSFGSMDYWNNRFTSNSNPFEWLEAPNALDPFLVAALDEAKDPEPQILHIGCGTSLLSYHLRAHVEKPQQVHNLDYSEVAIKIGRKREAELLRDVDIRRVSTTNANEGEKASVMRWSSANLLDHTSLLKACKPSAYSVIVDKSTSDCIACSDDVYVPLPYHITTSSRSTKPSRTTTSSEPIHPLHILAIHLAFIAKPGAKWIACSYSMDRFPFLKPPVQEPALEPVFGESKVVNAPSTASATNSGSGDSNGYQNPEDDVDLDDDLDDIPSSITDAGLPDPRTLWRLHGKYEIEPPPAESPERTSDGRVVHRPKVLHWVYVLERTDVELHVGS